MIAALRPGQRVAWLIALIAAAIAVSGIGPEPPSAAILGLVVLTIGLWATGALPEHVTAVLFLAVIMLFGLAPADVAFSGFHSAAVWLIFGGLIIGVAVDGTGLGRRLAGRLVRAMGHSYRGIIFGVLAMGIALGFLMPSSMGRVVLLMPIVLRLADQLGFPRGSPGRTGIVMAAALGAVLIPFTILPANVPNVVLFGLGEQLYGLAPTYGQWLLLHFPVLGLLKAAIIGGLILVLFPARPAPAADDRTPQPVSGAERRLGLILGAALLGFASDFAHGISPAWIALAAAAICMVPAVGLFRRDDFAKVNFASLIYVAGILGLGALVAQSGWGARLGDVVTRLAPLDAGQPLVNFLALSGTAIITGMGTTLPGVPAVLTPLAAKLAPLAGMPLDSVLMTQVIGFSTPLLPYQAPPVIVAMQLAGVRLGDGTRLVLATAVLTIVLLLPLDFLWWRVLGMI
ncbi:MAG TPA: SLC13 family permease [Kiloniellales bacterium]